MAVFVDPKTGEVFDNVPEEEAERAQKEFGLISEGEHKARQAWEQKSFGEKAEETALAGAKGLLRGGASLGELAQRAATGSSPAAEFEQNFPGEEDPLYGAGAQALAEQHPLATGIGQSLPFMVAGGAGGIGYGMAAGAGVEGVSQEAVDSVMQKRDFSAKSALMNGGINLAMGAIGHAGGKVLGSVFGAGDEAATAAAREAAPARNWVAEIDPGEVPEALGRRPARSAGAAAAANQEYGSAARRVDVPEAPRAPVEPRDVEVFDPASKEVIDATPEHLETFRAEMQDAAENAIGDKSLEDLSALPLGPEDMKGVEGIKNRADFQEHGDVTTDNFGSSKGGLPRINIEADGSTYLNNGRHRLAAARELDREFITARVAKYDEAGNTVWEATMPVRVKARPEAPLPHGRAANDLHAAEPFTDDLYEAATKSIDDAPGPNGAKGLDKEAQFLADPKTSEKLTELSAANVADTLDDVTKIAKDDLSVAVKNEDARRLAKQWTPEHLEAQQSWVGDTLESEAKAITSQIDASRAAAADVRAGRAGARAAGAEALDAGGIDTAIKRALVDGMDKVRRSTGAQQAIAVDNLKRSIGALDKDIARSTSIDVGTRKARQEMLKGFYTTLQKGLEDEGKYGAFAGLQKATNEAVTRTIEPLGRVQDILSKRLRDTYGEIGQAAINRETQAGAVASMLKAKPAEQREFRRALADAVSGLDDMAAARQAHGVSNLGALPRLREGLLEIEKEFRFNDLLKVAERRAGEVTPGLKDRLLSGAVDMAAGKVPLAGNALKGEGQRFLQGLRGAPQMPKPGTPLGDVLQERLKRYSRNVDLGDAGYSRQLPQWLQGALKGHGGTVAGVAGVGIGAGILGMGGEAHAANMLPEQQQARDELSAQLSALPPEQQEAHLRTAEAFARIQRKTEQRVQGAVKDLFALAKDPQAQPRHRSPQARMVDKKAADLDVPRHLARFMGKETDPVKAWKAQSQVINDVMADPAKLARTMADNLGELPRQQPEIFAKMVGQTMATVQYLHERMPGVSGQSALDPEGYPPTFEEISEWAGHVVGARYPLDSLDDLASNELVPEQMEAVQALWPEGYQMFQTQAMAQIHELSQQRKVIPLEALEQIDSALNLDGAGEPILSSGFADLLKQATAKQAEKMQQQPPPPPQPMQSQASSRMGSSSLASLHAQ